METTKIKHFKHTHFRGETAAGEYFVYCPVGNLISWNRGDYVNKFCAWCIMYFDEKEIV